MNKLLNEEQVLQLIHKIHRQKVMLDSDLAEMYGVLTKALNQSVKRNPDRFPLDFMFQISEEEWQNLKSQNVTSRWGGRRTPPYVFREQGVAMLSYVYNLIFKDHMESRKFNDYIACDSLSHARFLQS